MVPSANTSKANVGGEVIGIDVLYFLDNCIVTYRKVKNSGHKSTGGEPPYPADFQGNV